MKKLAIALMFVFAAGTIGTTVSAMSDNTQTEIVNIDDKKKKKRKKKSKKGEGKSCSSEKKGSCCSGGGSK